MTDETMQQDDKALPFDEACRHWRRITEHLKHDVLELMKHSVFQEDENPTIRDRIEMAANIKLAYRHLEDARMRIGKAIQAYDGGTSVYDK